MFDYLSHGDANKIQKKLGQWRIRLLMAKALGVVVVALSVFVWAIKS